MNIPQIPKNVMLLAVFFGLLLMKLCKLNGIIDDMLLLTVGAIVGKEVIKDGEKKKEEDS